MGYLLVWPGLIGIQVICTYAGCLLVVVRPWPGLICVQAICMYVGCLSFVLVVVDRPGQVATGLCVQAICMYVGCLSFVLVVDRPG